MRLMQIFYHVWYESRYDICPQVLRALLVCCSLPTPNPDFPSRWRKNDNVPLAFVGLSKSLDDYLPKYLVDVRFSPL